MNRLVKLGHTAMIALGTTGSADAADSPENFVVALEDALRQRDINLYASLLAHDFEHWSFCENESRDDELSVMSAIFDDSDRVTIVPAKADILFKDADSAQVLFEFEAELRGDDPIAAEVMASDLLRLTRVESGEWVVSFWIETYEEAPVCGTGSPVSWTDARSHWIAHCRFFCIVWAAEGTNPRLSGRESQVRWPQRARYIDILISQLASNTNEYSLQSVRRNSSEIVRPFRLLTSSPPLHVTEWRTESLLITSQSALEKPLITPPSTSRISTIIDPPEASALTTSLSPAMVRFRVVNVPAGFASTETNPSSRSFASAITPPCSAGGGPVSPQAPCKPLAPL